MGVPSPLSVVSALSINEPEPAPLTSGYMSFHFLSPLSHPQTCEEQVPITGGYLMGRS